MKKWAVFSLVLANALDMLTTALLGGMEGNEFARDASYHPLLGRLLVLKLVFFVLLAITSVIGYLQLKKWSQVAADCLVVGVCLFMSISFYQVALQNLLLYLRWYQP